MDVQKEFTDFKIFLSMNKYHIQSVIYLSFKSKKKTFI